ncbi:MAG: ketoacyl-ACP synthase III [Acidobacteria bacterium]|nr:ketoacyl-ACP synthase III [Acidobacteriota bacterium]
MRSRILGIGSAIPEHVLTNADLEKRVDTSDEWIRTRTGISERHIVDADTNTSDLAVQAGTEAIQRSGLNPEEIDALIVATATPDTVFPSTAIWAQPRLGLRTIPVFDISAACTGWLYGYIVADGLIQGGTCKHVLVIGAETLTKITNWQDRGSCILFGDGAGATVIGPNGDPLSGLLAHTWGADGRLAELLMQPAGGTRMQASHETVDQNLHTIRMNGNEVFKYAVRAMQQASEEVLAKAGMTGADVKLFVPHQANIRIITATAERCGMPMDKVCTTIRKYGNNSAASIPIALADCEAEGRLTKGDVVLVTAFGGGFTWGAALFRY